MSGIVEAFPIFEETAACAQPAMQRVKKTNQEDMIHFEEGRQA